MEELEKLKKEVAESCEKDIKEVLDKYKMILVVNPESALGNPQIVLKFK